MPTVFRIINKSDNVVKQMRDIRYIVAWFLGKRVGNYIVIKSDEDGDRVINFTRGYSHNEMRLALEEK